MYIPTHQFLLAPFGDPYLLLDRQCWHETLFRTIEHSCSKSAQEFVSPFVGPLIASGPDYTPWTSTPLCTSKLANIDSKLCIYTSTTFGNGRGISIFTTPSVAKEFAALPAFQDANALRSRDINAPTNNCIQEIITVEKGIGLRATKPLKFKDRITSHTPVFVAYLESELNTLEREQWWRFAVEMLPEDSGNSFLALSTIFGDPRFRAQDVVKANTFQLEVGGVNHLAIFPETSRLNHACNPNAQYVIDTDLLSHTVHATRPIAQGEEITISYTSPLDPISHRQQKLQSGFHFTCTCPRCTSPSSDDTLVLMKSLQGELNDWSPSSSGSPKVAEQLLQLYRDEGLEGFMDVAYGFTALAYSAAGDEKGAIKYAKKAKEAVLMKDGLWSQNLKIWEEMLADLKTHWSWRRRM